MVKKSLIHHITKVLIDIMFYGGIAACVALPFFMRGIMSAVGFSQAYIDARALSYTIILVASGLCAVYILYQLKSMFKTLIGGEPFVYKNVGCLRKCGVASFLISVIYLVRIIIWFTLGSSVIVVIFALLGLFSLTLKDVFKQAVFYKEENDWTV